MLVQTPVADLNVERTGSIQIRNGVLCILEMKVRQNLDPENFLIC